MAIKTVEAQSASQSPGDGKKPATAKATPGKPNIVFILMDNLGYGEPGCYGGGVLRGAATPRIDKLATEGTRLVNFNVEAQCTPSRSALMTGRFSIRSGTHSVPIGGGLEGMTQWEVTIAELLAGVGYSTAHFGKWHLGSEQGRLQRRRWASFSSTSWKAGRARREYPQTGLRSSWIAGPAMKVAAEFEQSLKKHPSIAPGTADPYTPPKLPQPSKENPKEQ